MKYSVSSFFVAKMVKGKGMINISNNWCRAHAPAAVLVLGIGSLIACCLMKVSKDRLIPLSVRLEQMIALGELSDVDVEVVELGMVLIGMWMLFIYMLLIIPILLQWDKRSLVLFAYIYCRTNSIFALYAVLAVGAVSQQWDVGAIIFAIIVGGGIHLIRKRLIEEGNKIEEDSTERNLD